MRNSPSDELSPGVVVADRYEVARYLGDGAPGQVYLAVQHPLDREVVLKVLPIAPDNPKESARFHREASALSRLSHPACTEVIDFGDWQDLHYLALRFVTGPQLSDRLPPSGRWEPLEAVTLCIDVAEGLAHAHDAGVVHRNLTPDRVVLTDHGGARTSARMVDFGLAHMGRTDLDTTAGARPSGTPGYMAPERIRGAPGDTRADVFSLGILLFEMLTGEHPFRRGSAADTLSATLSQRAPALNEVQPPVHTTPALTDVVRTATDPDPDSRFKNGTELLLALRAARSTLSVPELSKERLRVDAGETVLPPLLLERVEDPTPRPAPDRVATPAGVGSPGCLVTVAALLLLMPMVGAATIGFGVLVGLLLAQ